MTFREFLKNKRIEAHLSQNSFATLANITQSYYNGIERGKIKNPPQDDIIDRLVEVLHLNNEDSKKLRYLAAKEKTPTLILDKLNKLEQENSKKSKKVPQNENSIPLFSRVSAGTGAFTDEEPEDYISLPGIRNPQNMFAVNVSGDSMEPTIKDGSIILCNKNLEVREDDVAAFVVNGESYVKRIKKNRESIILVSDNPRYNPIYVMPYDDFKIVGKVLKVINDI